MGLFGTINNFVTAHHQKKLAAAIHPVNATYEENPYIKQLYGQGANLYQGRMAGAGAAEQNIATDAANTNASVGRNAGDAGTALAVAAGVQGQSDQSSIDLAQKEAQDKQNRFGVYSNVSQLMANEGNKVFQDKLRNYYDDLNYKRGLQGAAMQNQAAGWNGIDDTIQSAVSLFAPGGAFMGGGGQQDYNAPPQMRNNYGSYSGTGARFPSPNYQP